MGRAPCLEWPFTLVQIALPFVSHFANAKQFSYFIKMTSILAFKLAYLYIVKWIDVRLQFLEVVAKFHTVV